MNCKTMTSTPVTSTLEIDSTLSNLARVRDFVRRFITDHGGLADDEQRLDRIELAANEVVANIIRHAYHDDPGRSIVIEAVSGPQRIDLRFFDWGGAWDPAAAEPPAFDGSKIGGFGLYIISQAVDRVTYTRDPDGRNCAHLTIIVQEAIH